MKIPFLAVGRAYEELAEELGAAFQRVMESGWYVLGDEVRRFEAAFAEHCDSTHCVGVGSGLDALILALEALDVGPGDEVVVPANTYIATWLAVSRLGARPVPVEPDPRTFNLDPSRVEAALSARTRVLLPVHLYGQPADLDPILEIARRRGLSVVEDCAQAHGACYKGQPVGARGDLGCWSFYPGKNLGGFGDGGGVTTNDAALAERVRLLRNYGSRRKYEHEVIGINSRLDELQAAFLRPRLAVLDEWNQRRRGIAQIYLRELAGLDSVTLPFVPDWARPAWHLFVIRHPRRADLAAELSRQGIETLIHYPVPPHLSDAYAELGIRAGSLPLSERLAREVLSLPIGPHLAPAAARRIARAVAAFGD